MRRVHITISGKVQGVSFRYYAKLKAKELDLCGWVKNTKFKTVEVVAEGKDEDIDLFIDWCKEGPYAANIEEVLVEEEAYVKEFSDFNVFF